MPDASPDADPTAVIAELHERLRVYSPAERYPVQYATTSFHLGLTLLSAGQVDEAIAALVRAAELFDPIALPVEHAKAHNMIGVALRERGSLPEAVAAFTVAEKLFDEQGQVMELAAARHNRGLVLRDLGDLEAARASFAAALEPFEQAQAREQASACARELGTVLLDLERPKEAIEVLLQAVDFATRAGARVAQGAALNVLGIAFLRADEPSEARGAFEDATGAHPRSVRPAEYAMARANLALACELTGDHALGRLAARQALAITEADDAVRTQAADVLDRLGDDAAALVKTLAAEPRKRWLPIIREEMRRILELDDDGLAGQVAAWLDAVAELPDTMGQHAEAWLEALLEVPGSDVSRVAALMVEQIESHPASENLHREVKQAMLTFEVPQWMRLRDTFSRLATERGLQLGWD